MFGINFTKNFPEGKKMISKRETDSKARSCITPSFCVKTKHNAIGKTELKIQHKHDNQHHDKPKHFDNI